MLLFSLCPDFHFAQRQFRNSLAQGKNSHPAEQSDNSYLTQDDSGNVPIPSLRRTWLKKHGFGFVAYNCQMHNESRGVEPCGQTIKITSC